MQKLKTSLAVLFAAFFISFICGTLCSYSEMGVWAIISVFIGLTVVAAYLLLTIGE